MALSKLTTVLNTISTMDTVIRDQASNVKADLEHDVNVVKDFINNTLTSEIDTLNDGNVKLAGEQLIEGVKTFGQGLYVPAPTEDMQPTTKKYVDDKANVHKESADHDSRYFTETELGSIVDSDSGADKIGVTPIPTLAGENAQAVLESIKGRLDNIGETNTNVELSNSHYGANGQTYASVGARCDSIDAELVEVNGTLAQKAKQTDLDASNADIALKANQTDLNATNAAVALKINRDEIGVETYPLTVDNWTYLYANLPTANADNKSGYLYCTDGDGTHGAGKYYSNGTTWYFGGTGDEGYSELKQKFTDVFNDGFVNVSNIASGGYYSEFLIVFPSPSETPIEITLKAKTEYTNIAGIDVLLYAGDSNNGVSENYINQSIAVTDLSSLDLRFNLESVSYNYIKLFFRLTRDPASISQFKMINPELIVNGIPAYDASAYKWTSATLDATVSYDFSIKGISRIEFNALGVVEVAHNDYESNTLTSITTSTDNAFNGYRVLINPLKKIKAIKAIIYGNAGIIKCSILNSSFSVLAYATRELGLSNQYQEMTFVFDDEVSISTEYGYVEIFNTETGTIAYTPLSADNLNPVVMYGYKEGYVGQVCSSGTWSAVSVSQSLQFCMVFDVEFRPSSPGFGIDKEQTAQIENIQAKINIIECGKGKRYERLRDAIAVGCENGSMVIVYPGTYDLTEEFADVLLSESGTGIQLYGGVYVKFMAGSYVKALLDGSSYWANISFEPFKVVGDFTLDGLNIEVSNTRYCVHDEMGGRGTYYHGYKNCIMSCKSTRTVEPRYYQCIGGGLGAHGYIDIDGGIYNSYDGNSLSYNVPAISYHNGSYDDCDSKIFIKNTYLSNDNYLGIYDYGASVILSKVAVNGCSFGNAIVHAHDTNINFEITEWNNTIRP